MIFLSGACRPDLVRYRHFGVMLTSRMRQEPLPGLMWAADTGEMGKSTGDVARYAAWLVRHREHWPRLLFAVVPDVWADAASTRGLFESAATADLRALGVPLAFVAQPGTREALVPWETIRCLFIGGPDDWQWSTEVEHLIGAAHQRGVWVHRGRVSSARRLRASHALGIASCDGTVLRHDPGRLTVLLEALDGCAAQPALFASEAAA